jgi:hypothetical protein
MGNVALKIVLIEIQSKFSLKIITPNFYKFQFSKNKSQNLEFGILKFGILKLGAFYYFLASSI